jgi:ABC-2 type transport system permease protein
VAAAEPTLRLNPSAAHNQGGGVLRMLAARAFGDARTRTISFAFLFALYAYVQPVGFRHAYPTLAARLGFAHTFAGNDALRLFYGYPYEVTSIAGYSAWRVGGTLAIAAAVFGVLAAVRALRGEEDSGRSELVLAGTVSRPAAYAAVLAAIGADLALLWLALVIGFVGGGLALPGSLYLALSIVSVAAVFTGVGVLASQLAPTRRLALELGMGVVAGGLLLRVIADTSAGASWVRWFTPLGWAEQLRPFTGERPAFLLLPAVTTAVLLAVSRRIAIGRDIGTGLLAERGSSPPSSRLLGSAFQHTLRSQRSSLVAWGASIGIFALVFGIVSASISSRGISGGVRRELAKLGSAAIATPAGYLAFVFLFFALALGLFACAQVNAARHEEAEQRLEPLLALPLSRRRWLAARIATAAIAATALALLAGLAAWVGAVAQGVGVSLPTMLEAGANCLPITFLFLALALLAFALVPRISVGLGYGAVTLGFLWELVASLLGVPHWLLEATPFAHIALIPVQSFRATDTAVMLGIALAAAAAGVLAFGRRDLTGE